MKNWHNCALNRFKLLSESLLKQSPTDAPCYKKMKEHHYSEHRVCKLSWHIENCCISSFQGINDLHIAGGTQRGGHDGLGLATGKQGGTVNAGQNAHFNFDRANSLVVATVDPGLAIDNLLANHALLDLAEVLFDFVFGRLASKVVRLSIVNRKKCARIGKCKKQ